MLTRDSQHFKLGGGVLYHPRSGQICHTCHDWFPVLSPINCICAVSFGLTPPPPFPHTTDCTNQPQPHLTMPKGSLPVSPRTRTRTLVGTHPVGLRGTAAF